MTEQSTHEIMTVEMDDGVPTEPVSVETLQSGLESDTASVRTEAARVAAGVAERDPETVVTVLPTLIDLLDDDQRVVVYQTAMALSVVAEDHYDELEPAIDPLVELTTHELKLIRLLAARTLGFIALERADLFVEHVGDLVEATIEEPEGVFDDEELREHVDNDRVRGGFRQVNTQHELRQMYTRNVTVNLLIEVAEHDPTAMEPHVDTFVELLGDDDPGIARGSAEILGYVAREEVADLDAAVDPLVDLLDHFDESVVATAITTLGFVGDPAAAESLWQLADERDDEDADHPADLYDLAAETADFLDQ